MDVDGGDIKVNLRVGQDDVKPRLEENNALAEQLKKALESGTPIRMGGSTMSRSSAEGLVGLLGGGGPPGGTTTIPGGGGRGPLAPLGPTIMRTGERAMAPLGSTVWSDSQKFAPLGSTVWSDSQKLAPLGSRGPMRWAAGYDPKKDGDTFGKLNSVGIAYAARLAMGGGPAGALGGAIGAGIGAKFGGAMGVHAGLVLGGEIGSSMVEMSGLANPGQKGKFDRAWTDLKAVMGRNFTGITSALTDTMRGVGDLLAGGRGRSLGASAVEGMGQRLGSPADIYPFIAQQMLSQTPPANLSRPQPSWMSGPFGRGAFDEHSGTPPAIEPSWMSGPFGRGMYVYNRELSQMKAAK